MLLYLTKYLAQFESGFNVFNYLTMRAIMGALTALVLSFIIGPRMIKRLSVNQIGQPVLGLAKIVDINNVGVVDSVYRSRFSEKPGAKMLFSPPLRLQNFYGNNPVD